MKKPVAILVAACLTVLVAGPLMLNSSADNLGGVQLRTTPGNPYGWTTAATGTGTVEYTGGHQVPNLQGDGDITPHGGGSLTLKTGGTQTSRAEARNPYLDGALVSGVDIEYSWITPHGTDNAAGRAPKLELIVTGANGRETLTFDPAYNHQSTATPFARWVREDTKPPTAGNCALNTRDAGYAGGCWWSSRTGESDRFSLATYAGRNSGARVVTDQPRGAFAVYAGGSEAKWLNYEGGVDDVTLQRNSTAPPSGDPKTTFDFEPTILTVYPGSLQGWTFDANPEAGSTTPPSVALTQGPTDSSSLNGTTDNPFFGTGSVRFLVGNNGDSGAEVRSSDLDGRTVANIDALAYGTYVDIRADVSGCKEAPYMRLDTMRVAAPGLAAAPVSLFFHPCDQTNPDGDDAGTTPDDVSVPLDTWQRWDGVHGVWRWQDELPAASQRAAETGSGATCDGTDCEGTLLAFTRMYPGDEIVESNGGEGGSLRIGAGGDGTDGSGAATSPEGLESRWVNFAGNADFLTRDHTDDPGRTYDFEAQAPPPPPTTTTTNPNATTTTTAAGGTTSTTIRRTTTTNGGSGTTTSTTTDPADPANVSRRQGADRLATAIDISESSFDNDRAGAVVLARADNYPDALAATPVAANRRGPLLLTFPDTLDDRVDAEIRRVLPEGGTVHIAGGPAAVGPGVESRLRTGGFDVVRHNGRNRFETATLLAEQVTGANIAFLATGTAFADALPSGAAASSEAGVVLLTNGSSIPAETAAYLNARPGIRRVAVGGQAAAADPGAERVVGADRFATSVELANRFFPGAFSAGVASGTNFPDALAGGAHVGSRGGPLLLTPHEPLPPIVRDWFLQNRDSLRNVYIYGGPNAVSTNTENEIRSATS